MNGIIMYKGDFYQGVRNGEGKEYDENGILIFEGTYVGGEKWNGILREYFKDDSLKFEGMFLNGKKNGKCKEYGISGLIEFEGEFRNGQKSKGKGYEYNDIGYIEFEGSYSKDIKWNGILSEYIWESKQKINEERIVDGKTFKNNSY